MLRVRHILAMAFVLTSAAPNLAAAVDPEAGKVVFQQQCTVCHTAEPNDNGGAQGPSLQGVYDRKAASDPAFTYTQALRDSKIKWNEHSLNRFLAAPSQLRSDRGAPQSLQDRADLHFEALAAGESIGTVVFDPGFVVNGDIADVVLGASDGRLSRWTEFTAAPAVTMDPTRRLASITPAETAPLGADPGLADIAALLLAAEAVGAAGRCLELTVEYAKERVQFGRPIGSFQALKHRMADMYVKAQTASAVVDEALADPSPTSAALAHVTAIEAFRNIAGEAIQIHGGIAITAEHDIQLYFKRAHGSGQLFGQPIEYLRRLESAALA